MDVIKPSEPRESVEHAAPTDPTGDVPSVSLIKAKDYFGVHTPNQVESDLLTDLVRVMDADSKDPADFLWEIKQIENRIGVPPMGVSRMQHLYNFVKLGAQMSRIQQEMNTYGA